MSCRHRFELASYGIPVKLSMRPQITFRCKKCHETISRSMTTKEAHIFHKVWKESEKRSAGIHKLWHDFCSKFGDQNNWKGSGFAFMQAVDRYAKKHPDVIVTHCDDSVFCSSSIVLIPHRYKDEYMGTTMVIIPQVGGPPTEIFLYPHHSIALIEGLSAILNNVQPNWEKVNQKIRRNSRRDFKQRTKHHAVLASKVSP